MAMPVSGIQSYGPVNVTPMLSVRAGGGKKKKYKKTRKKRKTKRLKKKSKKKSKRKSKMKRKYSLFSNYTREFGFLSILLLQIILPMVSVKQIFNPTCNL